MLLLLLSFRSGRFGDGRPLFFTYRFQHFSLGVVNNATVAHSRRDLVPQDREKLPGAAENHPSDPSNAYPNIFLNNIARCAEFVEKYREKHVSRAKGEKI